MAAGGGGGGGGSGRRCGGWRGMGWGLEGGEYIWKCFDNTGRMRSERSSVHDTLKTNERRKSCIEITK